MGYISLETNNLPIKAITTTRQDGFSSIPYDEFNMSYDVGDDPQNVLLNRNKLCEDLKISPYNLIIPKQSHSDKILKITSITVKHGVLNFVWLEEAYQIQNGHHHELFSFVQNKPV